MISNKYTEKGFECLYNINSINNLRSIFDYGILSKNTIKQANIKHIDLSNNEVQLLRDYVNIGKNINLHDYANLYFNPRNAMLYYLICNHDINDLCVLEISNEVLDIKDSFVSDGHAAKYGTKFYNCEDGINELNPIDIFIKYWNDQDPLVKEEKERKMFAEALIKNSVNPKYIKLVYVANEVAKAKIEKMCLNIDIKISKYLFFEGN